MNKNTVSEIFTVLQDIEPEPKLELDYINPYTLLVAVTLSAQSTDVGVNKATKALFSVVDTPEKMIDLGEEGLKSYIKTIGLYNSKAKNILSMSRDLIEHFDGQVPKTIEELTSLAGVGRKTANVVLNVAFCKQTLAVDTHVLRVSNRIGLADGKTPEAVEQQLLSIVPEKFMLHAHHWLVLHGRYICKARKPMCPTCPIAHLCAFDEKTEIK